MQNVEEREQRVDHLHSTMKQGQWLFTCNQKPLQFHSWEKNKYEFKASHHDRVNKDSCSYHDVIHCGLEPISEAYALWFIQHEMWQHFDNIKAAYETRLTSRYCKATNTRTCPNIVFKYTKQGKRRYLTSVVYKGCELTPISIDEDTQGFPMWAIYELYVAFKAKEAGMEYEGI